MNLFNYSKRQRNFFTVFLTHDSTHTNAAQATIAENPYKSEIISIFYAFPPP